jgi:hypothetical protein
MPETKETTAALAVAAMLTYQQIAHEGWRPPETAPHDCEIMVEWNEGTVGTTHWVDAEHPNYEGGQFTVLGNGVTGWAIDEVWGSPPFPTDIAGWDPLPGCRGPTS